MTSPRILILDNSPRHLGAAWFGKWFRQLECQVSVRHFRSLSRLAAPHEFDALVITGSPDSATEDQSWLLKELELIEQADQRGMPVLGVCFGSQLLARAYYGKAAVRRSQQAGVPDQFTSFQFHVEGVLAQPGMRVLATSNPLSVQAFRVDSKPVWGIQFHFEVTPRAGRDLLRKTRHVYEPYGLRYEELAAEARPTEVAPLLFQNFVKALEGEG